MENINESEETLNTEEEETSTNDEQQEELTDDELTRTQTLADNQKIRAEKAEKKLKALEAKETSKEDSKDKRYSLAEIEDITALTSIPKEDREEVLEYAERKGIKPSEALNSPLIKTYLSQQKETRKTSDASNTGGSRRSTSKKSDEDIIKDFEKGVVDDSDKGIARLVKAQMQAKQAKKRT